MVLAANAALAKAFPYAGDVTVGVNGTDNNWGSYADFILPIASKETSFIFINPRMSMTGAELFGSKANELNLGFGFRHYYGGLLKEGFIFGVNAYYDTRNSSIGNNFQQAGFGIEFLSKRFDARVNTYIPFGNDEYFLNKSYNILKGHNIAATHYFEVSMKGFDGEAGINVPFPKSIGELRIFGGYYHFEADKVSKAVKGMKGRVEYRPLNILRFNYALYENKDFNGSHWQAGADINLPLDFRKLLQAKNPFRGIVKHIKTRPLPVKQRIGEMVMRDMYVRLKNPSIKHYEDLLLHHSGDPYHLTVVSPDGTGDGTFENPADVETGVALSALISGSNSSVLFLPGQYVHNNTVSIDFHQSDFYALIGAQELLNDGADLGVYNNGTAVINVADGITAFTIDNISSTQGMLISSLEFKGANNTAIGLMVNNYNLDETLFISNNSFTGFDTGIEINYSAGAVALVNNIITENNTGVEICGQAAYMEQNLITNNFVSGVYLNQSSGAIIRLNLFDGNENGVTIDGSREAYISENNILNSSADGINITSSENINVFENYISSSAGSAISADSLTSSQFSLNYAEFGGNGISVKNSSDVVISGNTANDNYGYGICAEDTVHSFIQSNIAENNLTYGISIINGSTLTISGNSAALNAAAGILIQNLSYGDINANVAAFNSGSGIEIQGTGLTVNNNETFENNAGILVQNSADIHLEGNDSYQNANGIQIVNTSNITVKRNEIYLNTNCGLNISGGSGVIVLANDAWGNAGLGGIYVNAVTNLTLDSNAASGNTAAGITVKNSGAAAIQYNLLEATPDGHGLFIENSLNIILRGNMFFQTETGFAYYGLYLIDTTTFNAAESGDNSFDKSGYGGDAASVNNYVINVKYNDTFTY